MRHCGALKTGRWKRFRECSSDIIWRDRLRKAPPRLSNERRDKDENPAESYAETSLIWLITLSCGSVIFPVSSICSEELPTQTSYTPFSARPTFMYSNLVTDEHGVSFDLSNTGSRAGDAVPEVYNCFPAVVISERAVIERNFYILGFSRLKSDSGESL